MTAVLLVQRLECNSHRKVSMLMVSLLQHREAFKLKMHLNKCPVTFYFLNYCKELSINREVPENIGQKQHLKHKEWVWETFTKRWSPHDASALKIRTRLDDNICFYISIKQCICISKLITTDTSRKQKPSDVRFYSQTQKKRSQEAEKRRKKEVASRLEIWDALFN